METTVGEILKKMKTLQCYYNHIKRENKVGPSGEEAQKKVKWVFFKSLKFLDANFTSQPTIDNIEDTPSSSSGAQYNSSRNTKRKRDTSRDTAQEEHNSLMARAVQALENDNSDAPPKTRNEDQLFGETVSLKLSKIADCDEKEDIKLDILCMLNDLTRQLRRANNM